MSQPAGLFIPPRPLTAADGSLLPNGQLFFFEAGTMTPLPVFQDADLTVEYTQPVVADAIGLWGPIFLSPLAYKVELQDENDVTIAGWPIDEVCSPGLPSSTTPTVDSNVEPLFTITEDAATVGVAETTLSLESITAGQLAEDGETLEIVYVGTAPAATGGTLRVSFGAVEVAEAVFLNLTPARFGPVADRVHSVIYQAEEDGFLILQVETGGAAVDFRIYANTISPPTGNQRGVVKMVDGVAQTATIPIPKGQYYEYIPVSALLSSWVGTWQPLTPVAGPDLIDWRLVVTIIRVDATTVRVSTTLTANGLVVGQFTTEVPGLTLSDAQPLQLTGEAATGGPITLTMGKGVWVAAPA